ncbi:MAG: hypothetical protein HW384_1518 [Dehalococcoidia bacterium]|nr:hypothetical protein [Dehalococcoidia bacterium]
MESLWQWIFATIGLVAFLMAIQPFTQFIWGRPKIDMEFRARDSDTSRYLDILLFNRPMRNQFLRIIKVRRDKAEDVFVTCNITNIQTDEIYVETLIPKIRTIHEEKEAISLPASTTPALITLIGAFDNGKVIIKENNKVLIPGKYSLTVIAHYAELTVKKQAYFAVGVKPYELCWNAISSS